MADYKQYRNGKYAIDRTADGLLDHLCNQMELLAATDITLDEAKEQSNLVKQANNVLRHKLDVQKFKLKERMFEAGS